MSSLGDSWALQRECLKRRMKLISNCFHQERREKGTTVWRHRVAQPETCKVDLCLWRKGFQKEFRVESKIDEKASEELYGLNLIMQTHPRDVVWWYSKNFRTYFSMMQLKMPWNQGPPIWEGGSSSAHVGQLSGGKLSIATHCSRVMSGLSESISSYMFILMPQSILQASRLA